jgi:hypothetical protein
VKLTIGQLSAALREFDERRELVVIYNQESEAVSVHDLEIRELNGVVPPWWGSSPWFLTLRTDDHRAPDRPRTVRWLRDALVGQDPEGIACAGWGGICWPVVSYQPFGDMLALQTAEGHSGHHLQVAVEEGE